MNKLRAGLPPITQRIGALPVDERGYPVPYFVATIDGKPEFRIADRAKWSRCAKRSLCWVCGQPLGQLKAFTLGPMCVITRTVPEPPEHYECALWSVTGGCPFLSRPKMERRTDEVTEQFKGNSAGIAIMRNPGAIGIWVTKSFKLWKAGNGWLITIGPCEELTWWREGRRATRDEVLESIRTGFPTLQKLAVDQDAAEPGAGALLELERRRMEVIDTLLPTP